MVSITTRSGKGSALTHTEVDGNFTNLKNAVEGINAVTVYATVSNLPLSNLTSGDLAYVSGTNRLYLSNGTGWYNIALVNQTPTITGNSATYDLAIDGTPTTVTLTGTDPEGIPLTWSATTSGDTNVATVTNSGNVFTITPTTNTANVGTITVTFSASDGINVGTATSSFSLAFQTETWRDISFSIGTTSTDGYTNSTFIDRSSSSVSVSTVGTPTQSAFHPYLDYWSMKCEAAGGTSGGGLDFGNNSTFALGTGDFTIEYWANLSTYAGPPLDWRADQQNGVYPLLSYTGSQFTYNVNQTTYITSSAKPQGKWHHVALVRNSGTTTMYVNGTSEGSFSDSLNLLIGKARVGLNAFSGGGDLDGYVSDVRVVKGTAVYTSSFTPPTEPLTAISGTILLTCQDNQFKDNSTNGWTPTVSNTPKISANNPYGQTAAYATADNKGSVYLNGSSSVDGGASINPSSGCCIEGWSYVTAINSYGFFFSTEQGATGFYPRWYVGHDNSGYWRVSPGDNTDNSVTSYSVVKNQWNHWALTNDGSTSRLFVNGELAYTKSVTPTSESLNFNISKYGDSLTYTTYGYISDFRASTTIPTAYQTSSTTVGTQVFTPPTSPTGASGAGYYLSMDNAGIYDKTSNHTLILGGDAATSTTQTKYASTSIDFDGTGDQITLVDSNVVVYGNVWTIEAWVYWDGSTNDQFFGQGNSSSDAGRIGIGVDAGKWWTQVGSNSINTATASANTWTHVAFVSNGSQIQQFINGTSIGTVSTTQTASQNGAKIGNLPWSTGYDWFGYVENFQVINGVAKYTSNFTVPSKEQGFSYQGE